MEHHRSERRACCTNKHEAYKLLPAGDSSSTTWQHPMTEVQDLREYLQWRCSRRVSHGTHTSKQYQDPCYSAKHSDPRSDTGHHHWTNPWRVRYQYCPSCCWTILI